MDNNQSVTPEDEDPELEHGHRSGNVFVIDASPEMFVIPERVTPEDEQPSSPFEQTLQMIERILRQKLCRNRDDFMAIILFATTKSDPDTKNILTLTELSQVSVEMIKELADIIDNKIPYYQKIASPDHYPLSEVILHATRAFDSIKLKMPLRQINLITCHDNPISTDNEELHRTRIICKNLHDLKINFRVIGMGDTWNFDLFYKELEMLARDTIIEPKRSYPIDLERDVMKKTLNVGKISLKIGTDTFLNVNLQSFVKRRKILNSITMDKATNEPLDNFFRYRKRYRDDYFDDSFDGDDPGEEEVEDYSSSSVRKSQEIAHRRINLTLKEYQELDRLKPKGIEVIKFQKCVEEPPFYHLQAPFFLGIPSDASPEDKKVFAGLLLKCRERKLMATCSATARLNAKTFLYRMWPCESDDGFYFYKIPFAEEMNRTMEFLFPGYRNFPFDEEKERLMEKFIKRFMLKFNPAMFPNPKQTRQMHYVLALALDENYDPTEIEDYTKPEKEILMENVRKKGLLDKVFEVFPSTNIDEVDEILSGAGSKVVRYDEDTAKTMARSNELGKFTVAQLRAVLKALGQATGGTKAVLIGRIEEYRQAL